MNNLVQALFFPLAILLVAASTSTASVLQDTCKFVAGSHSMDITYDYCLKFFQADGGSATADKRGLATIAARFTAAEAKSIASHIAALKASAKDKSVVECLSDCAEAYTSAVDQTGQAVQGIASGNAGGLQRAVSALSSATNAVTRCEMGFYEYRLASPLSVEDDAFAKDATIALAATSALLKSA
jgi:pectinesterase inhibitor-like protein